jgi:hypothetical protein
MFEGIAIPAPTLRGFGLSTIMGKKSKTVFGEVKVKLDQQLMGIMLLWALRDINGLLGAPAQEAFLWLIQIMTVCLNFTKTIEICIMAMEVSPRVLFVGNGMLHLKAFS